MVTTVPKTTKWADIVDSDDDLTPMEPVSYGDETPNNDKDDDGGFQVVQRHTSRNTTKQSHQEESWHTPVEKHRFEKPKFNAKTQHHDGFHKNRGKHNVNPVQEFIKTLQFLEKRETEKIETHEFHKENNDLPESGMFFDRETDVNEERFYSVSYKSVVKVNFQ